MNNLKEFAKDNHVPIIQDGGLDFLLKTINHIDAKEILELGSAIGYSAISMAKLSNDIHIDTIERNIDMYHEAVKNIADVMLNDQISIYYMDIKDFIPQKKYDLIFVDAAKGQYYNYLNQFIDYLKDDGVMFFDNMVFHGLTKNPDSIKNRNTRQLVKKINKFKELVKQDNRFDIILYEDIGDGILILTRRN